MTIAEQIARLRKLDAEGTLGAIGGIRNALPGLLDALEVAVEELEDLAADDYGAHAALAQIEAALNKEK